MGLSAAIADHRYAPTQARRVIADVVDGLDCPGKLFQLVSFRRAGDRYLAAALAGTLCTVASPRP
jgi:hypothetical protein